MSSRATGLLPSITARPSAVEKARVAQVAERAGMSESALALVAIRSLMDPDGKMPGDCRRYGVGTHPPDLLTGTPDLKNSITS